MRLLSIQVGLPRPVPYRGEVVSTGIFKSPVKGPVFVRTLNLEGDGQADLKVHGGRDKAVYAYSSDAYPWWKELRPEDDFPFGAFGENLTFDRLPEDEILAGDAYGLGEAVLQAVQPRFPCSKLALKFDDPGIVRQFVQSKRPGVYFRVLKEGWIDVKQELKLLSRKEGGRSIADLFLHPKKGKG